VGWVLSLEVVGRGRWEGREERRRGRERSDERRIREVGRGGEEAQAEKVSEKDAWREREWEEVLVVGRRERGRLEVQEEGKLRRSKEGGRREGVELDWFQSLSVALLSSERGRS